MRNVNKWSKKPVKEANIIVLYWNLYNQFLKSVESGVST